MHQRSRLRVIDQPRWVGSFEVNDPARLLVQPVPSDNKIGRVADVVRRAHGSVKQCRKLRASEVVRPSIGASAGSRNQSSPRSWRWTCRCIGNSVFQTARNATAPPAMSAPVGAGQSAGAAAALALAQTATPAVPRLAPRPSDGRVLGSRSFPHTGVGHTADEHGPAAARSNLSAGPGARSRAYCFQRVSTTGTPLEMRLRPADSATSPKFGGQESRLNKSSRRLNAQLLKNLHQ